MSLSDREIAEWKSQETTKKILAVVQEEIDADIAYVVSGSHIGETIDHAAMESCRIAGKVAGLSFIFNVEGYNEDE